MLLIKDKGKFFTYVILALHIIVIITIIIFMLIRKYEHTFQAERWITNPKERVEMVDNMLYRYELMGKTKIYVIDLLGEDDSNMGYFNEPDNLVYRLGDERYGIDSEWLVLTFEDDRVVNIEIKRD